MALPLRWSAPAPRCLPPTSKFVVTVVLVCGPCLWWVGRAQDEVLASLYPAAVVVLAGLASWTGAMRCLSTEAVALLASGLLVSVCHWPTQGFPALLLWTLLAWVLTQSLVSLAPSPAWVERRIVWLALINAGYALSQVLGYDPLFETATGQVTGLMTTRSQLGLLLLVAYPLTGGWRRRGLLAAAALSQSVTAVAGMVGYTLWRRVPHRWKWWVAGLVLGGAVIEAISPGRLITRMAVWPRVVEQILWSPIWGYGLGTWEAQATWETGTAFYNAYLAAAHVGGLLALVPLLWVVKRLVESAASPARDALGLLALAGLVQTPWHALRLVMITAALWAAWERRRSDAD